MTNTENTKYETNTDEETMAVLCDSYKLGHSFRYKMLVSVLKHMLSKIGTESTIYALIGIVRENRKEKVV